MRSTDSNILNPTAVNYVDLVKDIEASIDTFRVMPISKILYDQMQDHDPKTIYVVIMGTNGIEMYIGDKRVEQSKLSGPKYSLAMNDNNEFAVYVNHNGQLIEIQKFDDLVKAMNAVNIFNKISCHDNKSIRVYSMILSYLENDISIHDLFIGIIQELSTKYDSRLSIELCISDINTVATSYGVNHSTHTLPEQFVSALNTLSKRNNRLFAIYNILYGIAVKTDYFRNMNKNTINEIYSIFYPM